MATLKIVATQELQMMTFVHVFQSCSQDSNAVLAIMEDIIGKLKAIMPTLETVIYRQDNAGCYRSRAMIIGASKASQFNETVLGSSRKLGGTAEHLIDGSKKRICRVEL